MAKHRKHSGMPSRNQGFSLIESLIGLAIIGFLYGIASPLYASYTGRVDSAQAVADLSDISLSIDMFYTVRHSYPDSLAEVNMDGLKDPWGNPYNYLRLEGNLDNGLQGKARKDKNLTPINTDFDLYSSGEDGGSVAPLTAAKSQDDIVRANNGGYMGLAENY